MRSERNKREKAAQKHNRDRDEGNERESLREKRQQPERNQHPSPGFLSGQRYCDCAIRNSTKSPGAFNFDTNAQTFISVSLVAPPHAAVLKGTDGSEFDRWEHPACSCAQQKRTTSIHQKKQSITMMISVSREQKDQTCGQGKGQKK